MFTSITSSVISLEEVISLISIFTKSTYTMIRKKFIERWKISKVSMPLYHYTTKHRPKIVIIAIDLRAHNMSYYDWKTSSGLDFSSSSSAAIILLHEPKFIV